MKNIADTIITVVITFIISLVLNTVVNYLTQDSGLARIGSPQEINGNYYITIDLENYSSKNMDGLTLAVPLDVDTNNITSTRPLKIQEVVSTTNGSDIKKITISNIEPQSITQTIIPIPDANSSKLIKVVNAKELKVTTITADKPAQSQVQTSFKNALSTGFFNSILYGIMIFWGFTHLDNDRKKFEKADLESKERAGEINKKLESLKNSLKEMEENNQTGRLLLLSRISDYAKELSFWRDTIRKILYENKYDNKSIDDFIMQITSTLKTYGAREKDIDYDQIQALATYLKKAE